MILARSVHGAAKQPYDVAVRLAYGCREERKPAPGTLLDRGRREHIPEQNWRRIANAVLDAHGHAPVRVRREGERAVGERECNAAVTDAEPVRHLGTHRHADRRRVRCELRDLPPTT